MALNVLGAGFQRHLHNTLLISTRRKDDLTLALKEVGYRTVRAKVTTALAESMADLGHRAIAIVGHRFDQHGYAAGSIAFIGDFLDIVTVAGAGTSCDSPIHGVPGHIGTKRLVHRRSEPRIVLWQRPTLPGGDHEFADQLGEHLSALGVLSRLAMLDVGPFAVTSHTLPPASSPARVSVRRALSSRYCSVGGNWRRRMLRSRSWSSTT